MYYLSKQYKLRINNIGTIKYSLVILFLCFCAGISFAQTRPEKFNEKENMPKWVRNYVGELEVSKDGFLYPKEEFKILALGNSGVLVVYSIVEEVTFVCQNFYNTPENLPLKIKLPKQCSSECNILYYATKQGEYWVIDNGNIVEGHLVESDICLYNCGNKTQYFKYEDKFGKIYELRAGLKYKNGLVSSFIQLPREELVPVEEQQPENTINK